MQREDLRRVRADVIASQKEFLRSQGSECVREHDAILDDLRAVGASFDALDAIQNHPDWSADQARVLGEWLRKAQCDYNLGHVSISLRRKGGRAVLGAMIEVFEDGTNERPDAEPYVSLGMAIASHQSQLPLEVLLRLTTINSSLARSAIIEALGRRKDGREVAIPHLVSLLGDPATGFVIKALARLDAVEARDQIAPYTSSDNHFIRTSARTGLKKFDREKR